MSVTSPIKVAVLVNGGHNSIVQVAEGKDHVTVEEGEKDYYNLGQIYTHQPKGQGEQPSAEGDTNTNDIAIGETIFMGMVAPLVDQVFAGHDAVLICDGQLDAKSTLQTALVGAHKSQEIGLLEATFNGVFEQIQATRASQQYLVLFSMYAVTADDAHTMDLIVPHVGHIAAANSGLAHFTPSGPEPSNLSKIEVSNAKEILQFYADGLLLLRTLHAEAAGHHIVVQLTIQSLFIDSPFAIRFASLKIVQIRGQIDKRSIGGQNNTGTTTTTATASVQALNTVLTGLCSKNQTSKTRRHMLPFKSSTLCTILQPALGGKSLCAYLLVTSGVKQTSQAAADTALELLEGLQRLVCKSKKNKNTLPATIAELRREISLCRKELKSEDNSSVIKLRTLLAELRRAKDLTWETLRENSKNIREAREQSFRDHGLLMRLTGHGRASMQDLVTEDSNYGISDLGEFELEQTALSAMAQVVTQLDLLSDASFQLERLQVEQGLMKHKTDQKAKDVKRLEKKIKILTLQRKQYSKELSVNPRLDAHKEVKASDELTPMQEYARCASQLAALQAHKGRQVGIYRTPEQKADYERYEQLQRFKSFEGLVAVTSTATKDLASLPREIHLKMKRLEADYRSKKRVVKQQTLKNSAGKKVAALKKMTLEILEREFEQEKQMVIADLVRSNLMHTCMLTDHQHVFAADAYKKEVLVMFREYRRYFHELMQATDAKNMRLSNTSIKTTLKEFTTFEQLSQELETLHKLVHHTA